MAERPDRDDLPDDVSPGAFDGLGLDSLSDGVRPSAGQWAAIIDAADRRRPGGRPWLISAAAVLALVLGIGAVALARTGEEDIGIATGPGTGTAGTYVLPPADATDVTAALQDGGSIIRYTDTSGTSWGLRQGLPRSVFATTGTTMALGQDSGSLGSVDLPNLGRTVLLCSTAVTESPGVVIAVSATTAVFAVGEGTGLLSPTNVAQAPCSLDDPVVMAASNLRLVSGPEFERFIGTIPDTTTTLEGGPVADRASTTTTQVPPNVDPAARGRIIEAFERMDERDADGRLPYVDGEDAALMARVAAAGERTQVTAPTVFTVDDIDFLTPTSASVAFTTVASLPTGPVTTRHVGAAIVVDGRWQVTRETLEALVTQAGA